MAEIPVYILFVIQCFKVEIPIFVFAVGVRALWNHLRWGTWRGLGTPFKFWFPKKEKEEKAPSPSIRRGLLKAKDPEVAKVLSQIRKCSARKDAVGAKRLLDQHLAGGGQLTRSICHLVLETCAAAQRPDHMDTIVQQMREAGIVDVGSYNVLVKAHLLREHYDHAKILMGDMRKNGPAPTIITYNEMINGFARSRYPPRKRYIWHIIEEMRREGVEPNCFTCAIILKHVQESSPRIEVARAMELTNSLSCEMDEVLMASVIEAYVRLGKPDQVRQSLEDLHVKRNIQATTCSTIGSLIKGYGYAGDTAGVWRCWGLMKSQKIRLSGITISCMVEALSSNSDVDRARALIRELLEDEAAKGLIDPWVYGLVLKGYGKSRRMESMWEVYEEMLAQGIRPTVVTFNVLIDSCARNNQSERAPKVLQEMRAWGCEPNLITYSTLIKGYGQTGDMQSALNVLEELRRHRQLKPDEVVYKTLMDCCANLGCLHEAQQLFREMQAEGIHLTCYIVARMVKLLGNSGDLDGAFQVIKDVSQKHKFRPNSHVCNALVEACLVNEQPKRATNVCLQMSEEHFVMEPQLVQRLVMKLMDAGAATQAVGILSALLKPPQHTAPAGNEAVLHAWRSMFPFSCPSANADFLTEFFSKLLKEQDGETLAKPLVISLKRHRPELALPAVVCKWA